jgi:hypothetical protein
MAARQCGTDGLHQMVAPGGKNEQELGKGIHGPLQHHGPQVFGQRAAAGLTGLHYDMATVSQPLADKGQVRALTRTINPFENQKPTGHGLS